jgi:hypothetical protein
LIFVLGGVFGFVAGGAATVFFYPFLFPPPVVNQQLSDRDLRQVVATGSFVRHDPNDPVHWGMGSTTVFRDKTGGLLAFLEQDFEVGPGPKFHVYLVKHPAPRRSSDVASSEFLDLGQLISFKGSQGYAIPPGADLGGYGSLVIWCKAFGVLIAPATLNKSA